MGAYEAERQDIYEGLRGRGRGLGEGDLLARLARYIIEGQEYVGGKVLKENDLSPLVEILKSRSLEVLEEIQKTILENLQSWENNADIIQLGVLQAQDEKAADRLRDMKRFFEKDVSDILSEKRRERMGASSTSASASASTAQTQHRVAPVISRQTQPPPQTAPVVQPIAKTLKEELKDIKGGYQVINVSGKKTPEGRKLEAKHAAINFLINPSISDDDLKKLLETSKSESKSGLARVTQRMSTAMGSIPLQDLNGLKNAAKKLHEQSPPDFTTFNQHLDYLIKTHPPTTKMGALCKTLKEVVKDYENAPKAESKQRPGL